MNTETLQNEANLKQIDNVFQVNPELTREQFMKLFCVSNPKNSDDYKFNAELMKRFDEQGVETAELFAVAWMPEEEEFWIKYSLR